MRKITRRSFLAAAAACGAAAALSALLGWFFRFLRSCFFRGFLHRSFCFCSG